MVLLTPTPQIRSAIAKYNTLKQDDNDKISENELKFIDHKQVSNIANFLTSSIEQNNDDGSDLSRYRLATLLAGCEVYIAPKPPKPEPVSHTFTQFFTFCLLSILHQKEHELIAQPQIITDTRI